MSHGGGGGALSRALKSVSNIIHKNIYIMQNTSSEIAGDVRKDVSIGVNMSYTRNRLNVNSLNQHYARQSTFNLFMWLFVVVMLIVFTLQPLVYNSRSLNAGWTSTDGTYYTNAPMTVVGGSVNESTHTINTGTQALFTANGVNVGVLQELMSSINNESVWGDKTTPQDDSVVYLTAKDFGNFGDQSTWTDTQKGNAQIVLKLFDSANESNNPYNINEASNQYFQVVYRSVSATQDILTLYMVDSYTSVNFDDNHGDYTNSEIRTFVNNTYSALKNHYSKLDNYVVMPKDLPGEWQSSAYQTSYDANHTMWTSGANGTGLGSSGYTANATYWAVGNGMDGLNDRYSSWAEQDTSTYNDKMWIPSGFEVGHTGYGATDGDDLYDEAETVSTLNVNTTDATLTNVSEGEDGRTGMWQLNGYDRATATNIWLRSGYSNKAFRARFISPVGALSHKDVNDYVYGVRVAIHLDLKKLNQNEYPSYESQVTIENTTSSDALLLFYNDDYSQVFIYKLTSNKDAQMNLPKLVVGRTYTIKALGGTLSGTLSQEGGATVTQAPYTFVCSDEDGNIDLSGLIVT